jgi:hypothetical protein
MAVHATTVGLAVFVAYCGILVFNIIRAYVFGDLSQYNNMARDSTGTWHDLNDPEDEWNYSTESLKFHDK